MQLLRKNSTISLWPAPYWTQKVVLFRAPHGSVAALEDRCCHRMAPLSKGTIEADGIRLNREIRDVAPSPLHQMASKFEGYVNF